MKIGCAVLAAGNGCRFGGNKLAATWEGKTLIERCLAAVPTARCCETVVVTQYNEVLEAARLHSFTPVVNTHPEWGQSHSMHLALETLSHCDAILFMVADQPRLERETVERLLDEFEKNTDKITALAHHGVRGNPCLFPARFFPELLAVEGDRGGSAVIKNHPLDVVLLETAAAQLKDVDTPEALEQL